MEWYEPKEKTSKIDWRCDTDFWKFKIIDSPAGFILYDTKFEDIVLKIDKDIRQLFYCANDLELAYRRKIP